MFGGLVTSPLYVFPSMLLKSPTEEDYLGIYCLIFWTLSLIGVVKYANVAIRADDQGEGIDIFIYPLKYFIFLTVKVLLYLACLSSVYSYFT